MTKPAPRVVLFLGTANHDRSRVAEVLFNAAARKIGLAWTAVSRGLTVEADRKKGPMAAASVKALQARGLRDDDYARAPVPVAEADLERAALVVALDRAEHEPLVRERFPARAGKIDYWQIAPGANALPAIEREVSNLIARLLGGRPSDDVAPSPEHTTGPAATKPATVRVGRETKGRKGKGVTTISDLPLDDDALRELATLLKGRCGTGGTVRDGRIEIQGDQRDRLTVELEKLGYRVKRVGG
ncbi:MAG TPA: hypothetical protein VF170_11790 [Planctomycetaceae bacterium]